ncbi:MAG: hypothetical protein JXA96_09375 [Sedimentisphaerales bacterium]|nr:hypothetical protein [Sedimentisphaerales bacterium]
MENNQPEKSQIVVSKSFLAAGPTLHYSHKNVQRNWLLAVCAFGIACLFWSKIATGSFFSFEIEEVATQAFWRLDQSLVTGISIFEYPWQILVLGLLMGILAIVPVLISQLMCFEYSLPFILEVIILANLPGFAICLLISCFAVACRPLRFRSRFIAVALCASPQLAYWIYFGRGREIEPIAMGFSFVPWFVAWLDSLVIAGFVIGIGHFIRYKPGLIWIFTLITLIIAVVVFESAIGFDELDYQLYVAKNNPEKINEFHDHNFTEVLKKMINDPDVQQDLRYFRYPTDPNLRWEVLKSEIQEGLNSDSWPWWFKLTDELNYVSKKIELFKQYEQFIEKRPNSQRMPIVLYFSAILNEYSPDIKYLGENEILRFYSDYPWERSKKTWFRLYRDFGDSPESLEARWRIAKNAAGEGDFQHAEDLLIKAKTKITERLKSLEAENKPTESIFSLFQIPPESVMTLPKLKDLQRRIELTLSLIGPENRSEKPGVNERLARFVMLNPHSLEYRIHINDLLNQTDEADPLRDNILLADARLSNNELIRIEKLSELYKLYQETDGGMQALYDLSFIYFTKWRQMDNSDVELKIKYREEAGTALSNFISLYPDSFYIEQAKKYLDEIQAN